MHDLKLAKINNWDDRNSAPKIVVPELLLLYDLKC